MRKLQEVCKGVHASQVQTKGFHNLCVTYDSNTLRYVRPFGTTTGYCDCDFSKNSNHPDDANMSLQPSQSHVGFIAGVSSGHQT